MSNRTAASLHLTATAQPLGLPSQFQPGESCLVNLGGIHLHFDIATVRFTNYGKVLYTGHVTDQHGVVEIEVPSERCARGMDTMLDYSPNSVGCNPVSG